jgi:hypothetical protein
MDIEHTLPLPGTAGPASAGELIRQLEQVLRRISVPEAERPPLPERAGESGTSKEEPEVALT